MVELVDTPEGLAALWPEWRALEARAARPLLFHTADWVRAWFDAFAAPGTACVVRLRDGATVRALAPCVRVARHLGPFPVRVLALLHNPHSTRNDVLYAADDPGAPRDWLTGLLELDPAWDLIELRDLPGHSPTVAAFQHCLAERNAPAEWLPSGMRTPVLDCTGPWEAYYAGRSHNFRRNHRRAWTALQARGPARVACLRTADEVREGLGVLADLERRSWKGAAGTAIGGDPALQTFYEEVAVRFAGREAADLSVLYVAETPAAACLTLRHAGVAYGLKLSHDRAYAASAPGFALVLAMLERQWRAGATAIDMMQTSTFPAERLTDRCDERVRLRVFTRGLYSRLLGTLKAGWARRGRRTNVGPPV